MTFSSFIYKPNPKKISEDRMSFVYMFGFILVLVVIVVLIPGIKSAMFLAVVTVGLIKIKLNEIKKKGPNRFGSLPFRFELSPNSIKIAEKEFRIYELYNLEIEATDFSGGPGGDILSSSLGTENFISFSDRGEKHEYQFIIKTQKDLKLVEQIIAEITKVRV